MLSVLETHYIYNSSLYIDIIVYTTYSFSVYRIFVTTYAGGWHVTLYNFILLCAILTCFSVNFVCIIVDIIYMENIIIFAHTHKAPRYVSLCTLHTYADARVLIT